MASTAFSIRRYAGTMRVEPAAEGRRPLNIEDLPPIEARRGRWWMDELASAVAAAAAAVPRSPGKAKSAKKRPISDLSAAAPLLDVPPAGDSGCNGQAAAAGDEAMSGIVKRVREENCKSRLQAEQNAEEAAPAATPEERSGEPERNFLATKEVLGSLNFPGGLATQQGKIDNRKADTQNCIDNDKADKLGKPGDLGKFLPGQGILTYTRRTSVKMAKEKSAPLFDLNMEPPECAELDGTYDSNLERLGSQPPAADLERARSSGSSGKIFHGEPIKSSDIDVGAPPPSLRKLGEASTSTRWAFRLMGKDLCMDRGESSAETPHKHTADVFSGDQLPYENRYGVVTNSQANQINLLGWPPLPNDGSVALQNSPPPCRPVAVAEEPPTAPVFPITGQHGTPSSIFYADLPRQHVVNSAISPVCLLNSMSYTLSHPGQAVQEDSNSTGDVDLISRNPENETGRAVHDNASSSRYVLE